MILGDTIIPWLLGTLLLLALFTLGITIKSWREMKRSPYFFLRLQAEKRMQRYSLISLILITISALTSGYAWQPPVDNTPRVAILSNSKPPKEEIVALVKSSALSATDEAGMEEVLEAIGQIETVRELPVNAALISGAAEALRPEAEVVAELDVEGVDAQLLLSTEVKEAGSRVTLNPDTSIGQLVFSTEVGANYQPINPSRIFAEGYYTLYATFDYVDMESGMEWSWVWRHNGIEIDGGKETWGFNGSGTGYIFLSPEQGFQNGEYALEVWVGGEQMSTASVIMNNAAVSAGN